MRLHLGDSRVLPVRSTVETEMLSRILTCMIVIVAFGGCTRRSILFEGDVTLPDGHVLSGVTTHVSKVGGERMIAFWYETTLNIRDCKAMQREVRRVWSGYLRAEADRNRATEAQVVPHRSGTSAGLSFGRNSSGAWHEKNFGLCE